MLRDLYDRLFRATEPRRWYDVIVWWEARRAAYNLIMFGAGIIAGLLFLIGLLMYEPEGDTDPAIGMFFTAVGANVCYTFGWVVELALCLITGCDTPPRGPRMLKIGLLFSFIVLLIPAAFAIGAALAHWME